jgi:hypothetical protein
MDVDRSNDEGGVDINVRVTERKRTQFRAELLHEVGGDTFTVILHLSIHCLYAFSEQFGIICMNMIRG